MSNRMSVLSRRLERFAAGFSVATFAFFLLGLYAAANTERQVLFLSAGLGSVCFFAAFFLWLAHGFAWAMIPTEALVVRKPAEAMKPVEEMKPAEAERPAEALQPVEASKPVEVMKPLEALEPIEEFKPIEAMKPVEEMEPADDPPDAKYTITGKRIY
jgi:hypothetical protein